MEKEGGGEETPRVGEETPGVGEETPGVGGGGQREKWRSLSSTPISSRSKISLYITTVFSTLSTGEGEMARLIR